MDSPPDGLKNRLSSGSSPLVICTTRLPPIPSLLVKKSDSESEIEIALSTATEVPFSVKVPPVESGTIVGAIVPVVRTGEGTALTILGTDLLSNDGDPDGNTFSIDAVDGNSTRGAFINVDLSNGRFIYETASLPDDTELGAGDNIVDSFFYTIIDSTGQEALGTVNVSITGVDNPPVIDGFFVTEVAESVETDIIISTSDRDTTGVPNLTLGNDAPDFARLIFNETVNDEAFYTLRILPSEDDIGRQSLTLVSTSADAANTTTETFSFLVVDSLQRPQSTGFANYFVVEDQTILNIPLFEHFEDVDGPDSELTFDMVRNLNPFIYDSIDFDTTSGVMTLTFNREITGHVDLAVRATDADGLSANLDIFISIRDEFTTEIQAAAGTSEKRVNIRQALSAENVASVSIAPISTDSESFPKVLWDEENNILELTPTLTPSRNLFSMTFLLDDGSTVQRIMPATFTAGEVFGTDGSVGQGWFYSDSLGLYFRWGDWIYLPALGWIYIDITIADSIYFYSEKYGWFFTTANDFPYVFDVSSESWKYLHIDSEEPNAFLYDFEIGTYSLW